MFANWAREKKPRFLLLAPGSSFDKLRALAFRFVLLAVARVFFLLVRRSACAAAMA
jgi:hypothetical protein